jgi:2'-5' RNA ligase
MNDSTARRRGLEGRGWRAAGRDRDRPALSGSYALWLVPQGAARRRLAAAIRRLGRKHGGPVFAPHVTLLGGIEGDGATVMARLARLAAATRCFDVRLSGAGFRDEYFRCLFLRAQRTAALQAARRRAARIFTPRRRDRFMPHLSLFYGRLADGVRRREAAAIGDRMVLRFPVRAIDLVATKGEPEAWRRVRRVRLRVSRTAGRPAAIRS